MKNLACCTHPSTRLRAWRLLREKRVDCRKANALFPSVELLSGHGLSRIEGDSSGLAHGESPGLHCKCADVAECFHRMLLFGEIYLLFCWPGVSKKYLKMTEITEIKVSPNKYLQDQPDG